MRKYPLTLIMRGHPAGGYGALQKAYRTLSGEGPGRPDNRTRDNRRYCKEHRIRLSGLRLGRPAAVASATTRKQEYQDNTDRIEVERVFSLSKRCYGMGLIVTKLKETQLTTIALSVFVTNRFKDSEADTFCPLTDISFF